VSSDSDGESLSLAGITLPRILRSARPTWLSGTLGAFSRIWV
jgi:hypothetical protein